MLLQKQPLISGPGRIGDLTFYLKDGQMIGRPRHNEMTGKRAENSRLQSLSIVNAANLWRSFPPGMQPKYQMLGTCRSDYNMFLACARYTRIVPLTKHESRGGAAVVVPVCVSGGMLPPVLTWWDGTAQVTDIAIGTLAVDDETVVAELAQAILAGNAGFAQGDELVCYHARQCVTREGKPYADFSVGVLPVDTGDGRNLRAVVRGCDGFANRGGRLGVGTPFEGGVAWVHRRTRRDGTLLLSPQHLLVHNPLIDTFDTEEHRREAILSYGPVRETVREED